MSAYPIDTLLRTRITNHLRSFKPRRNNHPTLCAAAVAIVIAASTDGNDACFVLTRRPHRLRRHGGQYALPGGRVDSHEDAQTAALRELKEELGLTLPTTDVMGWLDDFPTRSGFCISPLVVWAGIRADIAPNPDEVEAVFRIPLTELDGPEIPRLENIPESDSPVLSAPFPTLGHEVYAPTAAILYQFREVALHGRTTRVAHFEQPLFAWR